MIEEVWKCVSGDEKKKLVWTGRSWVYIGRQVGRRVIHCYGRQAAITPSSSVSPQGLSCEGADTAS